MMMDLIPEYLLTHPRVIDALHVVLGWMEDIISSYPEEFMFLIDTDMMSSDLLFLIQHVAEIAAITKPSVFVPM
jgi:hypothetical protein